VSTVAAGLNQRWREGRARYRPAGETIRPSEYEVERLGERWAKAFVTQHHYSGSYPAARFRFGLYRHCALVGVAVFSQPVRDEVLTGVFATGVARDSVELGRFVLLDEVPGNGETWFLARCFEALRRERLVGVLSFSDPVPRRAGAGEVVFPGHLGTIYQAHNGVYLGRGTARTLRILPDGSVLSARALQKVRAAERGWNYVVELLVRHGAPAPRCLGRAADVDELRPWLRAVVQARTRPLRHPGNHKYAWALHRSAERFLVGRQPYPKVLEAAA